MTDQPITRRQALAGGTTALAGVTLLAACGSSPTRGAQSPQGNAGANSPQSGDPTTRPASGDPTTQAPQGTVLLAASNVPVGGSAAASDKGNPVVVSQEKAGHFTCYSAVCTHMGCTVNPAGAQLQCPCHGSVFNAFTGQVIAGPAPAPLPKVSVAVQGGNVVAT